MGTESLIAVADTGPLIHLAEIDSLQLLTQFDALHIPYAVLSETTGKVAGLPDAISSLPNLQKHTISQQSVMNYVQSMQLDSLHLGEQHSLYLCHRIGISTILTDDLAVRRVAKRLGLTPVGTLGIIVRAHRQRLISLPIAEQYLSNLSRNSTLYITKALIDLAIEHLHK